MDQPPEAVPFHEAELRALLRRHRERLATRLYDLFRRGGWPTTRAILLRVLVQHDEQIVRRILADTTHAPPPGERTSP